jgi:hypothetical protein
MSVATKFQDFCTNIRIKPTVVGDISYRYKRITRQLNTDFWKTDSDTSHSLYVGSYGRDTDIHTSDIDVLFQLPYSVYERINGHSGNGQSALLAETRNSLKNTYSTTHISSDGQVVKINFEDGINFEILPCFINKDGSYTYPDSNDGGSWKTTNPKAEIEEIRKTNDDCNGNLKRLCRMLRAWKDTWDVPMGGLLIDTLAYQFMKSWKYRNESFLYYDWMTRDVFEFLKNQDAKKLYWLALGSGQYVWRKGDFEYKALRCFNIANEAINYEQQTMPYSANGKWQEIYGTKF